MIAMTSINTYIILSLSLSLSLSLNHSPYLQNLVLLLVKRCSLPLQMYLSPLR